MPLRDQKPIRDFEDLPEEWQDPDFLRSQYRHSIILSVTFAGAATAGWVIRDKISTEIKVNPGSGGNKEVQAMGLAASASTAFAILGTLATLKLRKFLRQAEARKNNRDNPKDPEL